MTREFKPYVGPRPFERDDKDIFCGREREACELLSRIIAHPTVLFYSQSGAGKTSLLNARLVLLLENEGFEILPPARVRGLVPEGITPETIENLYVFNVLMSWTEGRFDPLQLAQMTIADFLKSSQRRTSREGFDAPRVAIFDQFEELFTFYPERWSNRQDFFDQICDALEEDRLMRVVFTMREDYIAELDPYVSMLPGNLRTRFRLERLREENAMQAVTEPLEGTGYSFAEGVAEQLVGNLLKVPVETATGVTNVASEFVEPVQLQVVCRTLWEKLQPSDGKVITQQHLKAFGDVDQALADFYERIIAKVIQDTNINEGLLRRWFEHTLITPAGTRGTVYGGRDVVGGIPAKVVKELVNQHLIRAERRGGARWYELTHDRLIEPIKASNHRWMLQRSGSEQTRQRLEARAVEWIHSGRDSSYLLDEGELLEARRWLESPSAEEVGYSEGLFALVQASRAAIKEAEHEREKMLFAAEQRRAEAEGERAEEQQRRVEEQARAARHLRRLAAALAVMFLLALGTAAYAVNRSRLATTQTRIAQEKEREAKEALVEVTKEKERADVQTKIANEQKQAADDARVIAEEQKHRAEDLTKQTDAARKEAEKQAQLALLRKKEAEQAKELAVMGQKQAEKDKETIEKKNKIMEVRLETMQEQAKELVYYERQRLAERLREDAFRLHQKNEFAEAIEKYDEARLEYQKIKDAAGQADMLDYMGRIYSQQKEYGKAEQSYKDALEIRRNLRSEDKEVAIILDDLAYLYIDQGRYADAETLFKQALTIYENVDESERSNASIATALTALGSLYTNKMGRFAEAELLLKRGLEIREKALNQNPPDPDIDLRHLSVSFSNLALLYYYQGKYPDAEKLYKRALSINEEVRGPDHPAVGTNLHSLALLYFLRGKYEQVEPLERRALVIKRKAPTQDFSSIATILIVLARLYHEQARYVEAEQMFNQAIEIESMAIGEEHPDVAIDLNYQAQFYAARSEYTRAEEIEKRAIVIFTKSPAAMNWRLSVGQSTMATIYAGQGKKNTEAEQFYMRALEGLEKAFGPDHPEIANTLNGLAKLYITLERYNEAEQLLKRALAIREKMLDPGHPDVAATLNDYGVLYANQKKYPEAEPFYKQALAMREKVFGLSHPYVAETLENYAALLRKTNRETEAAQMEARAKEIRSKYPQTIIKAASHS